MKIENKKILIVDNNSNDFEVLKNELSDCNLEVFNKEMFNKLTDYRGYDIIIGDFIVTNHEDAELLMKIKITNNSMPVIVYTNCQDIENVTLVMRLGAIGYILKSTDYTLLKNTIKTAKLDESRLYFQNNILLPKIRIDDFKKITGKSQDMGIEAAEIFYEKIKDKPIKPFTLEDAINIFTGQFDRIGEVELTGLGIENIHTGMAATHDHILLIDDEELWRKAMKITLKKYFNENNIDVKFFEASNVQEAISVFELNRNKICSCVIDMQLPYNEELIKNKSASGVDILRSIKTFDPRVECVILTAYADTYELANCCKLGAYRLLNKDNKDLYITTILSSYQKGVTNFSEYTTSTFSKIELFRRNFSLQFVSHIELLCYRNKRELYSVLGCQDSFF